MFFWRMDRNPLPNSHQKIWRTDGLRTGVVSDIDRVRTNPEDYGCQKWPPARHLSSSRLFFKFSDVSLGSDFVPFFKKVTCKTLAHKLKGFWKINKTLNLPKLVEWRLFLSASNTIIMTKSNNGRQEDRAWQRNKVRQYLHAQDNSKILPDNPIFLDK